MASNRELAAMAAELGTALGREVKLTGLNNLALEALVAELQSELAARTPTEHELADTMPATPSAKHEAEEPEAAPEQAAPEPEPEPEPEPAAPPVETSHEPVYTVAPNRGLTSLRGILAAGEVVSARDFLHGQETLDHLVEVGSVMKS